MQNTSKRQRRPARSAEEWKHTVDAWHHSGLTAKVYAEQHGIGADSLYRWATRLGRGKRALSKERSGKTSPRFVAVGVGAASAPPASMQPTLADNALEVEWPSGGVMRFRGHVSEQALATVLRALMEGTPC
jgi:hypothetical protein